MKKIALALILSTMMAGSALAATQDITVSATVAGTCKFDASSITTLAIGNLTPGSAAPAPATGALNFWCTKGSSYNLTFNSANGGNLKGPGVAGTELIPYTFALSSTSGTGDGPSAALDTTTASATVAAGVYDNNTAGAYSDTVTVTLTP